MIYSTEMGIRKSDCEFGSLMELAEDCVQWKTFASTAFVLGVYYQIISYQQTNELRRPRNGRFVAMFTTAP